MGKDGDVQSVRIVQPKRSEWPAVRAGLLILVVVICAIVIDARADDQPEYQPPQETEPVPWSAPGRAFFALCMGTVGLVLVVGLMAGIGALIQVGRLNEAKIAEVEARSRTIHQQNGLFPVVNVNGKLVNLNAAPAGIVEANGDMPDPETPSRADAVYRASVVQVAAASRGRRPMPVPQQMGTVHALPAVQIIDGETLAHVERLLLEEGGE